MDIGIPPYLLAASVTMVLSQRLARKLCPKCKEPAREINEEELEQMGFSKAQIPDLTIYEPRGCPACNSIGYKGRVGLYELMAVTEEVAKVINAAAPEDHLRRTAIQDGMVPLRDAGLEKIRQGVTSVEEVLKRTTMTKEALPSYLVHPDIEQYDDREVIIREGTHDNDFFQLVQGSLMVVKKGKKIAEIVEPGEYFGEAAVITGESRSASILSKGRSKIKRFPGDKLPDIMEKYPDVAKQLFSESAKRLKQTDLKMIKLLDEMKLKN